jgi:hypothetical protein
VGTRPTGNRAAYLLRPSFHPPAHAPRSPPQTAPANERTNAGGPARFRAVRVRRAEHTVSLLGATQPNGPRSNTAPRSRPRSRPRRGALWEGVQLASRVRIAWDVAASRSKLAPRKMRSNSSGPLKYRTKNLFGEISGLAHSVRRSRRFAERAWSDASAPTGALPPRPRPRGRKAARRSAGHRPLVMASRGMRMGGRVVLVGRHSRARARAYMRAYAERDR